MFSFSALHVSKDYSLLFSSAIFLSWIKAFLTLDFFNVFSLVIPANLSDYLLYANLFLIAYQIFRAVLFLASVAANMSKYSDPSYRKSQFSLLRAKKIRYNTVNSVIK
jgi:hypothetical protein